MIEIEFDNRLFLGIRQPVIARYFGVMLVGFSVAASPLIEGAAMDFSPGK
jgi:hypothetical protein